MDQPMVDMMFEVLANQTRRGICQYFLTNDTPSAEIDDLASYLTGHDLIDVDADCEQITTGLIHVHLPKMADAALLDYDDRTQTVRYRGHPSLEQVLTIVDGPSDESRGLGLSPTTPTEFRLALKALLQRSHDNTVPVTGFWQCQQDTANTEQYWEVQIVPVQTPSTATR